MFQIHQDVVLKVLGQGKPLFSREIWTVGHSRRRKRRRREKQRWGEEEEEE